MLLNPFSNVSFTLPLETGIFEAAADLSVNPITREGSPRALNSVILHLVAQMAARNKSCDLDMFYY